MTSADIDRAALLQAVIDSPADDLPRAAFADWLEENGEDGHAAFVRNWLALPGDRLLDVEGGRRSWWDPHGDGRLTHHLVVPEGCSHATWRRGFIEAVRLPLAAAIEHLPGLMREYPITRVEVADREPTDWGDGSGSWSDDEGGDLADGASLPPALFALLGGGVLDVPSAVSWMDYHSRGAAIDALSDALLRQCRTRTPSQA